MIDVIVFSLIMGFALGYFSRKKQSGDWYDMHDQLKKERAEHKRELQYYKKLCKTMAEENAEFRRQINSKTDFE